MTQAADSQGRGCQSCAERGGQRGAAYCGDELLEL